MVIHAKSNYSLEFSSVTAGNVRVSLPPLPAINTIYATVAINIKLVALHHKELIASKQLAEINGN